ncbi:protein transporter Sec31 [Streptacidiphilus sp. PAMC 29251]
MKTQLKTLMRTVPITIDGETVQAEQPYQVHVPVEPRDWDQIVLAGATGVAAALVTASVIWSTTSVGGLLSMTVTAAVAYIAALAFDLSWILALGFEWLARYDRKKVWLPRIGGYLALALAMTAVIVHGQITHHLAAGVVGAFVSALAKGAWTLLMHHHAKRFDPLTQQWVDKRTAQAGAQLAMVAIRRQLARAEDALPPAPARVTVNRVTDHSGHADATVRSAVRAAVETMPDATPDEIVEQLARVGIEVSADTVADLSGHSSPKENGSAEKAVTDTVRGLVRIGVRDQDAVLSSVQAVHGPDVNRDSVTRILRRVTAA